MSGGKVHYAAGPGDGDPGLCRFCGVELPPDRVGQALCGSPECHGRMIEESGNAILARKRAKHDEVTREIMGKVGDEVARAAETLDCEALNWMIPAQDDPLEPLPPERLERFREHLEVCATMAFREPEPAADADLSARTAHEQEEAPLVGAACGTCQGRCCRDRGGDTALLLPNDFARYRQRNPGTSKEQAIAAYLSFLPDRSTRDGCVYQAETGCVLPREMRQDICNSYYCDALRWLRMVFDEGDAAGAVLVAAHKGAPQRIAVMDADGKRVPVVDFAGGDA